MSANIGKVCELVKMIGNEWNNELKNKKLTAESRKVLRRGPQS